MYLVENSLFYNSLYEQVLTNQSYQTFKASYLSESFLLNVNMFSVPNLLSFYNIKSMINKYL